MTLSQTMLVVCPTQTPPTLLRTRFRKRQGRKGRAPRFVVGLSLGEGEGESVGTESLYSTDAVACRVRGGSWAPSH